MKTGRFLATVMVAVFLVSMFVAPAAQAYGSTGITDDYDQVIVFVHTNDVHGAVAVEPYVASVAAAMREEYGDENVIVANAGDTWGGATIASLSNGEYIAPIMNAVPYDVMTLGNDDIGRGTEQVMKVMGMNEFPTLSAGWVDAETGEHLADAYTIFDCGGTKVGVMGLSTEEAKPDSDWPTESLPLEEVAADTLAQLQQEGCDVIVALTHIGFGERYDEDGLGSMTLADNYDGIDLIIDGHSHTELPEGYVGQTGALVVQTGQNGANIGVSKVYLKDGAVVGADTQLITKDEYTEQYEPDADVQAVLDEYMALIEEQTSVVIGYTDTDLIGEREIVRTSETLLGDVLTDAIRDFTGADIAIYPSALIRSSLLTGDLTLGDYLSVFGSGCDTYVVESTGAQLKEILGFGLSVYPEQFMAFPQISGFQFTYDAAAAEITSLTWPDGTEIADDDTFTVALDLLYMDTVGVYDISGLTMAITGQGDMADVLSNYMNADGYSTPEGARITIENVPEAAEETEEAAAEAPAAEREPAQFVILHTNDTHGAIDGFPYLKTLKNSLIEEGCNVLLFDAGDTFYGENVATLTDGQSIAEVMESVGYDAMVLGNDDTTKGSARQAEIADYLSFPVLAANYTDLDGNAVVPGCTTIECGGYTFGVFGVTALVGEDQAERIGGYTTDPFEAAAACVAELEAEGADVIIALTHLGVGEEHTEDGSEALAAAVPGIDLIIDGHSHTVLEEGIQAGETLIVQTGEHFANIGKVVMDVAPDGSVTAAEVSLIPAEEFTALEPDADAQAVAQKWLDEVNAYTSEVLCPADYRLSADRPDIRCKETNLGNLVADVLVARTGADMALVPGFFIRNSVEAGDFTRGDVLNVLANGGDFQVYKATGEYIRELMEQCLSMVPEESGGPTGFRHVSGITIEFDSSLEPGSRITSIKLDSGEELDPEAEYTFASGTAITLEDERIELIDSGDDLQDFMMEYLASGEAVITEGPVGRLNDANG